MGAFHMADEIFLPLEATLAIFTPVHRATKRPLCAMPSLDMPVQVLLESKGHAAPRFLAQVGLVVCTGMSPGEC